ncbi:MAG TPA: OB-fold nucleic acid binding domain-containing protein, partial [Myxococcota bacterium]|nr:OB-fold nucleic acid binding domain-containing protein [Myxococcota bacterium]
MLARDAAGGSVTLRGWVRTARHSKGVSFLEISDGSCFAGLQVIAEPQLENFDTQLRHLQTGCAVVATGELVESPGAGQRFELKARRIELIGGVDADYPLQKKRHSFEFLRTLAHLRPRTNTLGAVFRVRNAAAMAVHDFFQQRGFALLHTPIITSS